MAACNQPDDGRVKTRHGTSLQFNVSPDLAAIDSLMWRQPDSALTRLLPCFDTCCNDARFCVSTATEYNRHYANLLLAELLYKNDYAQTNRPALLQAVAYYDSLCCRDAARHVSTNDDLTFLDARAHYINGVGYYETDSVVPACIEYLKALEVMERHFGEKELVGAKARFIALAYTRLANVFSKFYLHEPTIYFAQSSLPYYRKHETSIWSLAWVMNEIGSQYDMMDELDSADCYYKKAALALPDTNSLMFRDIATRQAYLAYKKSPMQANASILQLYHLLSRSENDLERLARSMNLGEIYFHEKHFDSAWRYLNSVYRETSSIGAKKQAAERLVDICKSQGKTQEMHEYAEFLVPFANLDENNSGLKTHLSELFNTFKQNRLEQLHYRQTKEYTRVALMTFGGMLVIMLTIFLLFRKNKQNLESRLEAEHHAHKMQQAALAGRLRQSNAALKTKDKTVPTTPASFSQGQNVAESFAEEPVCQRILAVCNNKDKPIKSTLPVSAYADVALNDAQKAQLKEAAMQHYGILFEKLKQQYPKLKEKDFLYCYLSILGLDNVQISVMLQQSISTIWERENRLKKIFDSESKIAVFLYGFMNT